MIGFLHGRFRLAFIFAAMVFTGGMVQAQYLRTQGKQIVDKNGQEVILRGMGLGGWMLQEGYMLETNSFANPQHQIRAKIQDLIGEANTNQFYEAWLANHCTERDVDSLASWGFNSVRLPMHYNLFTLPIEKEPVAGQNTWLDKGFTMVDNLLQWCAKNKIYLILDLHAAPGGQGHDAAISDYDATKPSLWESEANKQKTIALWRKLAERYANEPWIGGYDLINEPNWNFTPGANQNGCGESNNAPLRQLYMAITTAIREVDKNHIIFIEGNCWGNNYTGIFPKWDNNMAASFHKYWNNNDHTWFTNAISIVEANKIGWAWWPMKKVNSIVNPLTVVKNNDYNTLLNYWKNGGTKPTTDFAKNALMQLTENLKIGNTIYRKDVIDAMFRQIQSKTAIPFAVNKVPGIIHATDFDLGRNGVAYSDVDTANYQVTTGSYSAWNSGFSYRNDGVDIQPSSDTDASANGYNIGWTQDGEWLQYTIKVDSSAAYTITLRYATLDNTGKIKFKLDGAALTETITLASTGGFQTWGNQTVSNVILYKGTHTFRLLFEKGGANFGYMKFLLSKKISEVPFQVTAAETAANGKVVYITGNKKTDASTVTGITGFSAKVDGIDSPIASIQPDANNPNRLIVTLNQDIYDNNVITISYNADAVKATDGTLLQDFSNFAVKNNLPFHFAIPAKIEAEAFVVNNGLQVENTSDTDGGQNVGHTHVGDYLEYRIRVPVDGTYPFEARIACNSQAGRLEFQQLSATGGLLNSVVIDIPVTGGWQNWKTVTGKLKLTQGQGKLRVRIVQPEFNMNWFRFLSADIISGTEKRRQGSLKVYPNPADKSLHVELPDLAYSENNTLSVRTIQGMLVKNSEPLTHGKIQHVSVDDLPAGLYIIELTLKDELYSNKFIVK
jgi:hypothetical protein